jgi:hypothetical protein
MNDMDLFELLYDKVGVDNSMLEMLKTAKAAKTAGAKEWAGAIGSEAKRLGSAGFSRAWPYALTAGVTGAATTGAAYLALKRSKKTGKSLEERRADDSRDTYEAKELIRNMKGQPSSFSSEAAGVFTKHQKDLAKVMSDHPGKGALRVGAALGLPLGISIARNKKYQSWLRDMASKAKGKTASVNVRNQINSAAGRIMEQVGQGKGLNARQGYILDRSSAKVFGNKLAPRDLSRIPTRGPEQAAATINHGFDAARRAKRNLPTIKTGSISKSPLRALPKVHTVNPGKAISKSTVNAAPSIASTPNPMAAMPSMSVTASVADAWGRELAKEAAGWGDHIRHIGSLASAAGSAIANRAKPAMNAVVGGLNKAGPVVRDALTKPPTWQRAAVGAGVGAGVNVIRNRMKPKEERGSYLGAAAKGGVVGGLGGAASKGFVETSSKGGLGRFFAGNMGQPKPPDYSI